MEKKDWVKDFMESDRPTYVGDFRGLKYLIMVSPMSGDTNYWLRDSKQKFELSESGKRLYIVENDVVLKSFNMKSIASFGYTEEV